jgi:hypothetical protein
VLHDTRVTTAKAFTHTRNAACPVKNFLNKGMVQAPSLEPVSNGGFKCIKLILFFYQKKN